MKEMIEGVQEPAIFYFTLHSSCPLCLPGDRHLTYFTCSGLGMDPQEHGSCLLCLSRNQTSNIQYFTCSGLGMDPQEHGSCPLCLPRSQPCQKSSQKSLDPDPRPSFSKFIQNKTDLLVTVISSIRIPFQDTICEGLKRLIEMMETR
jgi:hypothetical protein